MSRHDPPPLNTTLSETLAVLTTPETAPIPVTASEVANELDCARRTAHKRLNQLVKHDLVETKKVGARGRVWWRASTVPVADSEAGRAPPKQHYRTLVENLPQSMVGVVNQAHEYVSLRGEALAQLDLSPEEATGKTLAEVWSEDAYKILEPHLRVVFDGETVSFDCPENDLIWSIHGAPVKDTEGRITAAMLICQPTTSSREPQPELEGSLRHYQRFAESFPKGVVVVFDREFRYTLVRGEAVAQSGLSGPEAVEGNTIYEMWSEETAKKMETHYQRVFEGETVSFEIKERGFDWLVRAVPLRNEQNGITAGMAIAHDITQQKKYERQLVQQREQLATINHLNQVFQELVQTLMNTPTRTEIEQIVCDRLVHSDSYSGAWIGDRTIEDDAIHIRNTAGIDGAGSDVLRGESNEKATLSDQALRTNEPQFETVEEAAIAAIPLTIIDRSFGVLVICSERPDAFTGQERSMVIRLGDVIGYILVTLQQKAALFADQAMELVFRSEAFAQPFVEVADEEVGQITIDHLIRLADDSLLVYITEPGQKVNTFLKGIQEYLTVEHVRRVETGTPTQQFEIKVNSDQLYSVVAEYGGRIRKVVIEDIECRMVVAFPPNTDIRRMTEGLQGRYPSLELVSQRSTRNPAIASTGLQDVLETQLTDRQQSAVEVAFYAGYFDWPRRSPGEEIASSFNITDSTFHEHLRIGTRKVLEAVLGEHG